MSEFTCSTSLVLKQEPVHSFTGQEKKPGQLTSHDLSRFVSCSSEWLDLSLETSIRKGNWTRSINPGVKGHPVQLGRKWIRTWIRTRSNTESHPVVRKYHKGPVHSLTGHSNKPGHFPTGFVTSCSEWLVLFLVTLSESHHLQVWFWWYSTDSFRLP